MKALLVFLGVLVGVPLLVGFWAMSTNNSLVSLDEGVQQSYTQVQNVMARQANLLPNMVETVKAQATWEGSTMEKIAAARSGLSAVQQMDPAKLANDPAMQEKLVAAQRATTEAFMAIRVVAERYPELKSNASFQTLLAELEGSQNRITVERRRNQLAVQDFNKQVRKWPSSMIAERNGYRVKPYPDYSEETKGGTPKIDFRGMNKS